MCRMRACVFFDCSLSLRWFIVLFVVCLFFPLRRLTAHNAARMNKVRRARSECMCVRLLHSLFRRDHEQVVEKIMPVDTLLSGLTVLFAYFAFLK